MPTSPRELPLITTTGPASYALIDSGNGRKLERFGTVVVDRPEAQAMWQPRLARGEWAKTNAVFSASVEDEEKGRWRVDKPVPEAWPVEVEGVTMRCKLAGLWHLGLFPEQLPHWQWMQSVWSAPHRAAEAARPRLLNLFAYTGAASLIAARAGADVVHVDASKKAIAWGRENAAASGLEQAPIRWICEDARRFVAREVRRGRSYDVILVDPPKFGRGPDGEVWELFEHLPALMADCAKLLAPGPARLILTAYAIRASALALDGLVREVLAGRDGHIESGELALQEQGGGRLIGTSMYTRWQCQRRFAGIDFLASST